MKPSDAEDADAESASQVALMQRWDALQQQLTQVRRHYLQADANSQAPLQAQVRQLEQALQSLEQQIKQSRPNTVQLAWPWSIRVLSVLVVLPILIVLAIMAKYWLTERELSRFFQQQPPLAQLTVSTAQPVWLEVAGVEIQLQIEWIGRLELAKLSFKTPTGTLETHSILGGEVLALPKHADAKPLHVHVQAIDYEAKTVQLQLYDANASAVTKMRQAKFISKAKRRSPALTTTPVLL